VSYYITIDKEDVIWGCGETPEEAFIDAKDSGSGRRILKSLECTREVYFDLKKNGYCHGDGVPYWEYDTVNKIAFYPSVKKRSNVFKTI